MQIQPDDNKYYDFEKCDIDIIYQSFFTTFKHDIKAETGLEK